MRLLFLFLLIAGACQGQTLLNRQVILTRQSGTAGEFLEDINNLPGITLSYSSGVIDLSRKVQVTGQEKTIEDFLRSILSGQAVKYQELNGKIFLLPRDPVKKKFTLSGYVTDNKNGERLIGASFFLTKSRQGTTSNIFGFFSITLEEDSIELYVSHSGYTTQTLLISLHEDILLNIAMEQKVVMNEIVVVNAESRSNTQNRTLPGKIDVPASLIKSVPALFGEPDVLKTLQLLPGIQAGNEGTSGLIVRGGSADQNLVLLDGVPVYNASHAFGLFSIFNGDAVRNVEVLKGGFPASYGGRLSSVVDVQMKEGDRYQFHGEGGIGLIFSKLTLEGPLEKGRSSFLVSARRTYADLIIRPIARNSEEPFDLKSFFSDVIVKANFPLKRSGRIYLSFYRGIDKFLTDDQPQLNDTRYRYDFAWGNITAMMRWNHEFSKKLFSNLTFNYSRFRFKAGELDEFKIDSGAFVQHFEQRYLSSIQDFNLKYDIDFLPAPDHFIKLGMAATLHYYRPGIRYIFLKDTITKIDEHTPDNSIYTGEYDIYAEDDIRFSSKLKANLGVRFSGFSVAKSFFFSIQPRLNAIYKLNDKWSLKASAAKMNQYIHLLTNSNMGLPTDLWVPVTTRLPPQLSYQFSAGVSYSPDQTMEASAEIYYKSMKHVIEYKEGMGFNNYSYTSWEDLVELGKGNTYGSEWLLQKRKGKLTGLIGYTLSWSNRKFPHVNGGKTFPYKYDRRHELKMAIVWKVSKRVEFSSDWLFATGNSVTLPVAYYKDPYTGRTIDIYSGRNDFRLPVYHRLDVSGKFSKQKKKFIRTWIVGVYNVYNRKNPFYLYSRMEFQNGTLSKNTYRRVSLFPILPFITYQFKF